MKSLNRIDERREAVDATDLFLNALDPQHVAHGRARLDEAEWEAAFCQLSVQRPEHFRAGQVKERGGREIADDELDRLAHGIDPGKHAVEDVFGVEIDDAGLDAEGDDARRRLVVGMALEIGVAAGARDASEEGDMRR